MKSLSKRDQTNVICTMTKQITFTELEYHTMIEAVCSFEEMLSEANDHESERYWDTESKKKLRAINRALHKIAKARK